MKRIAERSRKPIRGQWTYATLVLGTATTIALVVQTPLWAVTLLTIHSFDGADGSFPVAGLVQGTDGNLYGTTQYGGTNGLGTVFSLTLTGTLTTLHSFGNTDGAYPSAGLVQGTDGNFYGTTEYGGTNGLGTVFSITSTGILTTLYTFNGADGATIVAGLIQAADGSFYGTSQSGGANGNGTIFSITSTGSLTTLYSFCSEANCADGAGPTAGLAQNIDRNFYGATFGGGANGLGTIFKVASNGRLRTLYNFCSAGNSSCTDGELPDAGLIGIANGSLFGTTTNGGVKSAGTLFKVAENGRLITLYNFCSETDCTDGKLPQAGLIQYANANLFGTTLEGGAYGDGTVFKISPTGALTVLHSFDRTDGAFPRAGVIAATNKNLFGTTWLGGANGVGTVFEIQP